MRSLLRPSLLFSFVLHAILLGTLAAAYAADSDGPYLMPDGPAAWKALWVDFNDQGAPGTREKRVQAGDLVDVAAVGDCPAFTVRVRKAETAAAPDTISFPAKQPLFVLADTHGEYATLCELLKAQKIVNSALHWSFGKGHLAVLGDIFDRGAHQTEILWLLYQLEAEAKKAGGGVHIGLGNHEWMALRNDTRYLNPKYLQTANALGVRTYSDLFSSGTLLGAWLRTKPAVYKVNSVLCLHGGISKAIVDSKLSVSEMNNIVRSSLDSVREPNEREQLVLGPAGPLWYRGYFQDPRATDEEISAVLYTFKSQYVAVGHTIVPTVTPLYHSEVIAVQVWPHLQAAIFERGAWERAKIDGTREPLGITN